MIDGCFTVDFHVHLSPRVEGMYGELGFSPDECVARMERNHVDHSVVFPMVNTAGLTPESTGHANDYVAKAIEAYPDQLTGFALVTPRHGDFALREMERAAEMGFKGIKLHPHLLGFFPIDNPIVDPLMEKAAELGFVVITHSDVNSKRCSPYQVKRLAQRHPDVNVAMAHWGCDADFVHFIPELIADTPNLFAETSNTPNLPEFIFARPSYSIPDQILLGSDAPTLSMEVDLAKLRVAEELYDVDPVGKAKLLGLNAARILGLNLPSGAKK